MLLGIESGLRVGTLAEAYPAVLEIVRRASVDTLQDQAGGSLRELMDFRVELTAPAVDLVPSFYSGDRESLDDYFKRQFLDELGLFSLRLNANAQLEAVLNHVVDAVSDPERPIATRRAILIVPHEIVDPSDIAPLGLVSIRIVPRFPKGRPRLSYSFAWRTVEALVGFPYSLYGSIRYSQHLTSLIAERVEKKRPGRSAELGDVSYIAHSLHIFYDEHVNRIVRRIINEASD